MYDVQKIKIELQKLLCKETPEVTTHQMPIRIRGKTENHNAITYKYKNPVYWNFYIEIISKFLNKLNPDEIRIENLALRGLATTYISHYWLIDYTDLKIVSLLGRKANNTAFSLKISSNKIFYTCDDTNPKYPFKKRTYSYSIFTMGIIPIPIYQVIQKICTGDIYEISLPKSNLLQKIVRQNSTLVLKNLKQYNWLVIQLNHFWNNTRFGPCFGEEISIFNKKKYKKTLYLFDKFFKKKLGYSAKLLEIN